MKRKVGSLDWLVRGPLGDLEVDLNDKESPSGESHWGKSAEETSGGWDHRDRSRGVCCDLNGEGLQVVERNPETSEVAVARG